MLPEDLMRRIRGYQESRVLLTAIELDVFTAIGDGATAIQAASVLGADARATAMLLNAAVSLGVLTKTGEVFHNTPESARYFVKGSPEDERMAQMHSVNQWRRWSNLTECVRAGTAVDHTDMAVRGPEWAESFIAAMHSNASVRAPLLVEAVGAERVSRMLDLGGGSGAYSIAFAQASPGLRAEILDLAAVVPIAQRHIEAAGMAGRVTPRAGDFLRDSFECGYDLVLLSAICHMLAPEENRALIAKSFAALTPGGRIVIQDFILDPDRAGPPAAALFALNMLVGTARGDAYTEAEYREWLREAGFGSVRRTDLPGPASLILGTRPEMP